MRESVQLCAMGHQQRFRSLDNLANALFLRFLYEGHLDSSSEAIDLYRQVVYLLSESHPERPRIMNNLANALLHKFHHSGNENSLVEAISVSREAMKLAPPGYYWYADAMQTLGQALEAKFDKDGDIEALSETTKLYRDVVRLRPLGHTRRFWSVEGLARVLFKCGSSSSLEAISCYQEALNICPVGCPDRTRLLSGMGRCFLDPHSPSFSLSEGISCLSEAYADTFSHVYGRLRSAIPDLQQLETACHGSKQNAQISPCTKDDEHVLDLYAQAIGLLPLAANFGLDHRARLQAVTGSDAIARNAAARAVILERLPQAVEMLEQGRGVFWTQTLHLRTTAFDGVPEADCLELQRTLRLLEIGACRVESLEQSVDQRERDLEQRRQLNEAVQALITKIRGNPGLDRFLLPPAFEALLSSLPDGFVVILNASKLGHHALLLHRSTGLATSLVLKLSRTNFDSAKLRDQLPRDMASVSEHNFENDTRAMRIAGSRVRCFEDVLSLLWTSAVQPVLDKLRLNVS
jgi:tetratricopeptide (TPR) repeat protein